MIHIKSIDSNGNVEYTMCAGNNYKEALETFVRLINEVEFTDSPSTLVITEEDT